MALKKKYTIVYREKTSYNFFVIKYKHIETENLLQFLVDNFDNFCFVFHEWAEEIKELSEAITEAIIDKKLLPLI